MTIKMWQAEEEKREYNKDRVMNAWCILNDEHISWAHATSMCVYIRADHQKQHTHLRDLNGKCEGPKQEKRNLILDISFD